MTTTSGRIRIQILWNFAGQIFPLIAAVGCIPVLIKHMGAERFGLLTLTWSVVGYFSLFDFGVSRAVTQMVSEKLALDDHLTAAELYWAGLVMALIFGCLGTLTMLALLFFHVDRLINMSAELTPEFRRSVLFIAFTLPFLTVGFVSKGILEAYQKFRMLNLLRIPVGVLNYLAPALLMYSTNSLSACLFVILLLRILSTIVQHFQVHFYLPVIFRAPRFVRTHVKPLLSFGGWMTVTNVVGPLLVYLDRFLIASVISASVVAFYTTPYEMVTKLWVIPGAVLGVMFPVLAKSRTADPALLRKHYVRTLLTILGLCAGPVLIALIAGRWILSIWINPEFAAQSVDCLRVLVVGTLASCLALVPFTFIQSAAKPKWTACLHLCEIPFYLGALYFTALRFGIVGVATVWTCRVIIDGIILAIMANRLLRTSQKSAVALQCAAL